MSMPLLLALSYARLSSARAGTGSSVANAAVWQARVCALRGGCDSSCGRGRKRRRRGRGWGRERVLFPWQEAASGGGDRYIDSRETFLPLAGLRRFKVLFFSALSLPSFLFLSLAPSLCLSGRLSPCRSQSFCSRGINARKTVNSVRFPASFASPLEFHSGTFHFFPFSVAFLRSIGTTENFGRKRKWRVCGSRGTLFAGLTLFFVLEE